MAIKGSCLCGAFQFEVDKVVGPFELCHCNRCRKLSGSIGLAMVGVNAEDYRVIGSTGPIGEFSAPILHEPPAYHCNFCATCGSPLPDPAASWFEIPAGLFDDDPGLILDKRIYVEHRPSWDNSLHPLPQYTASELASLRRGVKPPARPV